jgi:hypothetical protein
LAICPIVIAISRHKPRPTSTASGVAPPAYWAANRIENATDAAGAMFATD